MTILKNSLKTSSRKFRKTTYNIGTAILLTGLVSCGTSETEYETTEVLSPTQGIVTKVKEVEEELFKITDEDIVSTPEDSRIIASYMDGVIDTFTLEEAQLVDAENPRRNSMRGILLGGMIGYMMGKNMSTPINRAAYANDDAYKKSQGKNTSLKSTASRKTVSKPKKGFGSSKSSRSYGG